MFDIGWSELAVIGVVALVVVGPKDLPKLMRTAGQMAARARRMADEFRGQVTDAMRETDLDEMRQSVNDLRSLNPANMIRNEISKLAEPINEVGSSIRSELSSLDTAATDAMQPSAITMPSGEPTLLRGVDGEPLGSTDISTDVTVTQPPEPIESVIASVPEPIETVTTSALDPIDLSEPHQLAGEPYFPAEDPVTLAAAGHDDVLKPAEAPAERKA